MTDIEYSFVSHVGCVRSENQDSYADLSHRNVFAIADGMGGHQDGALASHLATKAFSYQADRTPSNTAECIRQAHDLVVRAAEEKRSFLTVNHMGTTGVVLYLHPQEKKFIVSWCGDSRAYHYIKSEDKLVQVTTDHSYVQELVDRGEIDPQEAANHPKKNIITHAIGVGSIHDLRIDTKKRDLEEGDILLLCTDGLSNEVDDQTILHLCSEYVNMQELSEELVQHALNNGGRDNVTVCCIRLLPFD